MLVTLFLLFAAHGAQEWNNPSVNRLGVIAKNIVIPRIEYVDATGVEILEFVRYKIWSVELLDGETTRLAHEYRCSPDRLLKKITFRRQNLTYADALSGVCKELGLTWSIERGKIVFTDANAQEKKKSEQGVAPNDR